MLTKTERNPAFACFRHYKSQLRLVRKYDEVSFGAPKRRLWLERRLEKAQARLVRVDPRLNRLWQRASSRQPREEQAARAWFHAYLAKVREARQRSRGYQEALTLIGTVKGLKVENSWFLIRPIAGSYDHDSTSYLKQLERLRGSFRSALRECRATRRIPKPQTKHFRYSEYVLMGGVFTFPNAILHLQRNAWRDAVEAAKTPGSRDRYVGIEIEFISPNNDWWFAQQLAAAHLSDYVTLKNDGSIEPKGECSCDDPDDCNCDRDYGHELCVLAKERDVFRIVRTVCQILKQGQAYVNHSCGLHVHLDARTRPPAQLYGSLVRALPLLMKCVPPSRLNNGYCRYNKTPDYNLQLQTGDRYCMVNAHSYKHHKTIEVRLHSGTVNPEKIYYWVQLLLAVAAARGSTRRISELSQLKLSRRTRQYIAQRIVKLQNNRRGTLCESEDDLRAQLQQAA